MENYGQLADTMRRMLPAGSSTVYSVKVGSNKYIFLVSHEGCVKNVTQWVARCLSMTAMESIHVTGHGFNKPGSIVERLGYVLYKDERALRLEML
jgi:hypothetical protein